jgi:hypothetical protein
LATPTYYLLFDCALALDFDHALALSTALDFNLAHDFDFDLDKTLMTALALALDLDFALNRDRTSNYSFDPEVALAYDFDLAYANDQNHDRATDSDLLYYLTRTLTRASTQAKEVGLTKLERSLEIMNNKLSTRGEFIFWWESKGQKWIKSLRVITIQHRNIGHDWQFSMIQKESLKRYHDANKLLVDCLNSDCYISREVRTEIEDTLLLPISSI